MAGEMTTDVSTGAAVTVTASDPDVVTEPATAVAVIVADPAPTAVTSPVDDTPATLGAELVQLIVAEIAVPAWSLATALNCSVCPAASELLAPVGCVTETVVRTGAGLDGIDGPPPESPPPEQAATRSSAPTRQRFVPRRGTKFPSPGSRSRPARAVRPATPSVPMNRSIRVVLEAVVFIAAIALSQKPLALAKPESEYSEWGRNCVSASHKSTRKWGEVSLAKRSCTTRCETIACIDDVDGDWPKSVALGDLVCAD